MSGEDKVSGGELCPEEKCVCRRSSFRRINVSEDQASGGEMCPKE